MCSRPDCAERGVARALIEPRECRIIIDRRVDDAGAAILCVAHADRVTVPKGWTLDDRRENNPRLFGIGRFNEPKPRLERLRRLPEAITAAVTQPLLVDVQPYDLPEGYEESGAGTTSKPDGHGADARSGHVSATDQALARARARALDGTDNALFGDIEADASLLTRAFSAARSRMGSNAGLAALIPPGDEVGRPSAGASR